MDSDVFTSINPVTKRKFSSKLIFVHWLNYWCQQFSRSQLLIGLPYQLHTVCVFGFVVVVVVVSFLFSYFEIFSPRLFFAQFVSAPVCACYTIFYTHFAYDMNTFKIKIFEIRNDLLIIRKKKYNRTLNGVDVIVLWCYCRRRRRRRRRTFRCVSTLHNAQHLRCYNANGMFCHWSFNYHWIRIHRHLRRWSCRCCNRCCVSVSHFKRIQFYCIETA